MEFRFKIESLNGQFKDFVLQIIVYNNIMEEIDKSGYYNSTKIDVFL
jgi:hypothetical protein